MGYITEDILDVLCIRHGEATYDNTKPPLTERGIQQAHSAGATARELVKGKKLHVWSSPLPRAMRTAGIICQEIGYPLGRISRKPEIRCTDFYFEDSMRIFWHGMQGHDIDRAYMSGDPWFEYNPAFESRSSVRRRTFRFVGELYENFNEGTLPGTRPYEALIVVSHAEVLNNLSFRFGLDVIFQCDMIQMRLTRVPERDRILIETTFKGTTLKDEVFLPSVLFGRQFQAAS